MSTITLAISTLTLLAVAAVSYRIGRSKTEENRFRVVVWSITLGVILLVPITLSAVSAMVRQSTVESAVSPDGRYEAYVRDEPAIDGPNHSIYLRHVDHPDFAIIEDLPADVDALEELRWSPDSDLVLFRTRHWLIVTRPNDFKTVKVPLSRGIRRPDGAINFSYAGMKLSEVDFAGPSIVRYRFAGSDEFHELRVDD